MNESTKHLLSGLLADGGIGAGIGAAGMGASEAMAPEQEGHKKSILKSMLLGGAMGGLTGAGGRAIADGINPELQHDPRTMLASMFENKTSAPPAEPGLLGNLSNAAAGHPTIATIGAGVGTAGASAIANRTGNIKDITPDTYSKMPKSLQAVIDRKKLMAPLNAMERFQVAPHRSPLSHGALASAGTYAVSKLLNQNEANKDLYRRLNDPNAFSERLSQGQ